MKYRLDASPHLLCYDVNRFVNQRLFYSELIWILRLSEIFHSFIQHSEGRCANITPSDKCSTVAIKSYGTMNDANAAMTLLEKWPEKFQALNEIRTRDLCDTGAMRGFESRSKPKFFQVIFPEVSWLHLHLLLLHNTILSITLILKCYEKCYVVWGWDVKCESDNKRDTEIDPLSLCRTPSIWSWETLPATNCTNQNWLMHLHTSLNSLFEVHHFILIHNTFF